MMLRPLGIPRSPQAPHRQTCSHCLSLAESGALFGVRQNLDPTPERGKSPSWAINNCPGAAGTSWNWPPSLSVLNSMARESCSADTQWDAVWVVSIHMGVNIRNNQAANSPTHWCPPLTETPTLHTTTAPSGTWWPTITEHQHQEGLGRPFNGKGNNFGDRQPWVQIPALPLPSWVALHLFIY